jgi:hypothetical protein
VLGLWLPPLVVRMPSKRLPRGYNPASLENLVPNTPLYGECKSSKTLTLTPTAWDGIEVMAASFGLRSRSDLVERLGRGLYRLVPIDTLD